MLRVFQHNCARSYEWTIAALETGVERWADVGCMQVPPTEKWSYWDQPFGIRNKKKGKCSAGDMERERHGG